MKDKEIEEKKIKYGEVGQRIRQLRKKLGLTQTEFGEKIGRAWKTINRWEAGEREISEMALRFIASTFGVSYEWLTTGQGEMWERKDLKTEEVSERFVKIPVVGKAGAGFPEAPGDLEIIGYTLVNKETYQQGGKYAVQVSGDSMQPTLQEGDYVVFKAYTGDASDISNGKVVVVRNCYGELIVKRLKKMNGAVLLTSDNPKYPPLTYEQARSENLQIVGVGVKVLREIEL